ncbi:hypothetical protein PRIPAC_75539 [Pristionchus pacificus]|uniref:Uncharacterized protein n=1 Tax=Pristionchus pacificus TaxID=54126 RepID=A0A454XMJ7_PRIPA|nr:hypothetical protein PRIPAC_75539 [Pristionchus pacificus]|eukprot:PDM64514.1 hypothetical protein PRIPAC_52770 [Pristionchus pacificus]
MILEILLMLRSSIVLLEDQPPYMESLWNHSNNYLVTTLDDFDLFDLPILDDLDDFFEDFDYRSLFFFDLGMTGYEKSAQPVVQLTSHISPPPVRTPERIPKPVVPKKQKALKMQQKYEKKQKYQTKKYKPTKFGKRKS